MRRMDRMGCSGTMGVGEGEGTGAPVWESVRKLGKKKEASMIMHVLQR